MGVLYFVVYMAALLVLMVHMIIKDDIPYYGMSYRVMIANESTTTVTGEEGYEVWSFGHEELGHVHIGNMSSFFLLNDVALPDMWYIYLHPVSLYWLIKFKKHLKHLRNARHNNQGSSGTNDS